MRRFEAVLLLLIVPALIGWSSTAADRPQDYFTPDKILSFAEHLYDEGDYLRSAAEYIRYLYIVSQQSGQAEKILFRIGECFRLGENYAKSREYFEKIVERFPESPLSDEARIQIGYCDFLKGDYVRSLKELKDSFSLVVQAEQKQKIRFLEGVTHLYRKDWTSAGRSLNGVLMEPGSGLVRDSASELLREMNAIRRKDRFLAGVLSAVIPGAGKIYAGRTGDGIVSFFSFGLSAWQSYEGFKKDGTSSIKGWIYGALSAFLYVGNVYGTIVAVQIYNETAENKALDKAGVALHVIIK